MSLMIEFRFPHRQYQATPWDVAVNSGAVEWPPAPWRIARALLSVWHTRYPDLPPEQMQRIVSKLAAPPWYRIPDTRPGHTRHYMPDLGHISGATGNTTKTLAPYLSVDPTDPLVVLWPDVELESDDREVVGKLVASMSYLGRADSICEGRVVDGDAAALNIAWHKPDSVGHERVLCLSPETSIAQLEVSPTEMRKARRTQPEGSSWVAYPTVQAQKRPPSQASRGALIDTVRWRVEGAAPFRVQNGILATTRLRAGVVKGWKGDADDQKSLLHGHGISGSALDRQHRHAHWLWAPSDIGDRIKDLILWVPDGIDGRMVGEVLARADLSRRMDYEDRGFVPGQLNLLGAGSSHQVMPDFAGLKPTERWVSVTPYLPNRQMRKRRTWEDLIVGDLLSELSYRFGEKAPTSASLTGPLDWETARRYRRHRPSRKGGRWEARPGAMVAVEFDVKIAGPLVLGALSHFGFGLFRPDEG